MSWPYPTSYSVDKDGSFVGNQGAISSSIKVKNEWSSTFTSPIRLYDRKETFVPIKSCNMFCKNNKKSKCFKSVAWDM
jgi:hypothetical protein